MRKRLWSPDEDEALQKYVSEHGFGNWSEVAKKTGLQRCGKSCRLRWINYLRPDLKRGKFTMEEKMIIVNLQSVLGNSWSKIAAHLPGRTDSDIKNFWHSHFRKKRLQQTNSFLSGTKVPESRYTYNPTAGTDAWNPKYTAAPAFHAWELPFNRSMNPYDNIQSKELDLQSGQKFPTVSPSSVLTELPSYVEIPDRGGLVDPDLISAFCNTNWHDGASSSSTNLNLQKFNRDAEAPLEGLDLVVWSCANRTVPQTEQVAPDQVASWSVLDPQLQNVAYGFSQ